MDSDVAIPDLAVLGATILVICAELLGKVGGGGRVTFLAEVVDGVEEDTDFWEEDIVVKICKMN